MSTLKRKEKRDNDDDDEHVRVRRYSHFVSQSLVGDFAARDLSAIDDGFIVFFFLLTSIGTLALLQTKIIKIIVQTRSRFPH